MLLILILIVVAIAGVGLWLAWINEVEIMKTIAAIIVAGVLILIGAMMWGLPIYNVWNQRLTGEAELARAQQNRQIRVQEAQAKLDAAKLDAQAEVERAKGTAQANQLLQQGLGGPEGYLRWMYIHMLEETARTGALPQIIYIPTEAGMPILEAGRHETPKAQ